MLSQNEGRANGEDGERLKFKGSPQKPEGTGHCEQEKGWPRGALGSPRDSPVSWVSLVTGCAATRDSPGAWRYLPPSLPTLLVT